MKVDDGYQLTTDIGPLSVPDTLHGVLAARLDALDPRLQALVADASVFGGSFPIQSLIAVSGRPTRQVEEGLAELVRRGVLDISADPLSPERGSYRFGQNMLRQVAYDTLARRDRRVRHLVAADHLQDTATTAGDEVMDVVARHYLDALSAVPEDPDNDRIRGRAISALVRAGDRAERSGAPARALQTFTQAAELAELADRSANPERAALAAQCWESAAAAADKIGAHEDAMRTAERATGLHFANGDLRAAARAQGRLGRALMMLGRTTDARKVLQEALAALRSEPDSDTVTSLYRLAVLEIFDGNPVGPELGDEAQALGQSLGVSTQLRIDLFICRGLGYAFLNRDDEAIAQFEYAAQLADGLDDGLRSVMARINLSHCMTPSDPSSAATVAKEGIERCRRLGAYDSLAVITCNLAWAKLACGEWGGVSDALAEAMEQDSLAADERLLQAVSLLAALRGDIQTATALGALPVMRASEDSQDFTSASLLDGFVAAASGRPVEALGHAKRVLRYTSALGLAHENVCWAWPLATRSAFECQDEASVRQLLTHLDAYPSGHLPPILGADRTLARARLAATDQPTKGGHWDEAVRQLRVVASPYHLAQALLDQATFHQQYGLEPVASLIDEAEAIAEHLGARPIRDRAAALTPSRVVN